MVALCPTWGRPAHILNNTLALFLRQTHTPRELCLYDDLGNVSLGEFELPPDVSVVVKTRKARASSLPAKYDQMVEEYRRAAMKSLGFVTWDDDDVYLPWYLEECAQLLNTKKPMTARSKDVWSTYQGLQLEGAAGRFHGAFALNWAMWALVGGWLGAMGSMDPRRADFDQRMLAQCCGRGTADLSRPGYVVRWGDTGADHCQGRMRTPEDVTWWTGARPQWTAPVVVVPALDASAQGLLAQLAQ